MRVARMIRAFFILLIVGFLVVPLKAALAEEGDAPSKVASAVRASEPVTSVKPKPRDKGGDKSDKESKGDTSRDAEDKPSTALSKLKDAANKAVDEEKAEQKSGDEDEDKGEQPQVEIYIPSVQALVTAAERSKTAELYRALSGMFALPKNETGEEFDFQSIISLVKRIGDWPDTSIGVCIYSQDREGRPRWALRLDWPLEELRKRVKELLSDESAAKLMKDVQLRDKDGVEQVELADVVLAVLRKTEGGSMLASGVDLQLPDKLFGQKAPSGKSDKSKEETKGSQLVYCLLNLKADEEKTASAFSMVPGVNDVRYGLTLGDDGLWRERFNVRWNPFIGAGLKLLIGKTAETFECPREALAMGVVNLGTGEGMADQLAGLPFDTIGARAKGDLAYVVLPSRGFLPIPDFAFIFHATKPKGIVKAIREAMEKDAEERVQDDRPIAWRETDVDGSPVFWCDPAADAGGGMMPLAFRTVIFVEPREEGQEGTGSQRLVILRTAMWPDDAVTRWNAMRKDRKALVQIPTSKKAHWQAIINWKDIYAVVHPYVAVFTGISDDETTMPATADELKDALKESVIDMRIEYAGLDVRHTGPIPFGAAYVPGVAAMSLSATANPWSEAERERVACRQLRVLYHHAKLFKKDYGRWPSSVAELDGYVDFDSHPGLLSMRPKDESFAKDFLSMFTARRKTEASDEEEERKIDDSLYEIEWSADSWELKFRKNEFVDYKTIAIDQDGEIHRIPLSGKPEKVSSEAQFVGPPEPEKC